MSTLFDDPLWPQLKPHARLNGRRDNLDFKASLPANLRQQAVALVANCIACGALVHPVRVRASSHRSRISGTAVEGHLFYAATCATEDNAGCSRTKAATTHKGTLRGILGLGPAPGPTQQAKHEIARILRDLDASLSGCLSDDQLAVVEWLEGQ